MKKFGSALAMLGIAGFVAGCATPTEEIAALYVSPVPYQAMTCRQLADEAGRVSAAAASAVGRQDEAAQRDAVAMGVGLVLFWPALFAVRGNSVNEAEVAQLRGEMQTIEAVSAAKGCPITFQAY